MSIIIGSYKGKMIRRLFKLVCYIQFTVQIYSIIIAVVNTFSKTNKKIFITVIASNWIFKSRTFSSFISVKNIFKKNFTNYIFSTQPIEFPVICMCADEYNTQTHYPVVKRRGTHFIIQMSVQPAVYRHTAVLLRDKGRKNNVLTVYVRTVRCKQGRLRTPWTRCTNTKAQYSNNIYRIRGNTQRSRTLMFVNEVSGVRARANTHNPSIRQQVPHVYWCDRDESVPPPPPPPPLPSRSAPRPGRPGRSSFGCHFSQPNRYDSRARA